ncbi:MgtC/SapB family protein [Candidatus Woesearchaeota archaeon]|nr:MgtC/SapB family protein [Candidatus Woesearchaeota archaeon]
MIDDGAMILRIFLAVVFGALLGYTREHLHRPAGLRTHMLVSLGSCIITIFSMDVGIEFGNRIISGIVTGIGFLGAGTIFRLDNEVHGLTTAASLWTMAAIGMVVGAGEYLMSFVAVIITFIILELNAFSDIIHHRHFDSKERLPGEKHEGRKKGRHFEEEG